MFNLYDVAQECKDYMLANITKRINKVHSGNLVFTDYDIIGDLKKWEDLLLNLQSASRRKYPSIASQLKEYIYKFDEEPIVYFSSICAIIDYRFRHISTVSLRIISIANRKTYPHRVYLFPLVDTLTKETEECTRREN